MNRIRNIYELFRVLVANKKYLKVKELKELTDAAMHSSTGDQEIDIKERTIKQYLVDINKNFPDTVITKTGIDGGYKITDRAREGLRELLNLSLSDDERNALNDAFEQSKKSLTFHYNKDLTTAKMKLYDKKDLKDQDFEYYLGIEQDDAKVTEIIKILKNCAMDHYRVKIKSKYDYYEIKKGIEEYKPLYIVHDSDESFVVLKDLAGEYYYQNILNILDVEVTSTKFDASNENKDQHISDYALKIKGTLDFTFTVIDERGRTIMDLWNYEYEDISEHGNHKEIRFHEVYKSIEFMFRMQTHIKGLKIHGKSKQKFLNLWNEKVDQIRHIN